MTQHQYPSAPAGQPRTYPVQGFPQQAYPIAPRQQSAVPYTNSYLELGKLGAVVGLCGAGAANLGRLGLTQE